MTIQQRKPLNGYLERKPRSIHPTHISDNGHLPTADLLAGLGASHELVAGVQTWHDLVAAEREQARKAAAANVAADAAALTYRGKVRDALTAGADPASVKDETEKHRASAAAHLTFMNDARIQRQRLGVTLGPLLGASAADLFATAEVGITDGAAMVTAALAEIHATWLEYSRAFQVRYWLSLVAHKGGTVPAFHGSTGLPAEVAAALVTLEKEITALDLLKSDEAAQREYRDTEASAAGGQHQ